MKFLVAFRSYSLQSETNFRGENQGDIENFEIEINSCMPSRGNQLIVL